MVTDATHPVRRVRARGPELPEALARLTSWDPALARDGRGDPARRSATFAPSSVRPRPSLPVLEAYVATEFARYAWETVLDAVRGRVERRSAGSALRGEGGP
jgi:hypothetical protein